MKSVRIDYYRWEGQFLFFKVQSRCSECDMSYVILNRLMAEVFQDKPVELHTRPWLNHWYRTFFQFGWFPPIILINGKKFSQKIVPDVRKLIQAVGHELGDDELVRYADTYVTKQKAKKERDTGVNVYFSPACPHCNSLKGYLEANGVSYTGLDVSESESARNQLKELTRSATIPVIVINGTTVQGFDRERIRELLGIDKASEQDGSSEAKVHIPSISPESVTKAMEGAKDVLEGNFDGTRTKASGHLYPHQWNWDAGFISRGYLHYQPERAYGEMRTLFGGMWSDGFLPHIIFNDGFLDHFPGFEYWKAYESGRIPDGLYTSGISQPPVHASMLLPAPELDPDRDRAMAFLNELYPKLAAMHDFYFDHRDPDGEHLVSLVHPWESGLDNAPIWDEPLAAIQGSSTWAKEMQAKYDELAAQGERPKRTYIEKYSYLIESMFSRSYQWDEIMLDHPFQVQDVLFNAVLCKSEKDLAKIAELTGNDAEKHRQRADQMTAAINRKLWDDEAGLYYGYDRVNGRKLKRDTIFSYMPLYAEVCEPDHAKRLMDNLKTHCFCVADKSCVGIPSYDMCKSDYNGEFYWRGPIWINMCWYMARGFEQYGQQEQADWVKHSILQLVAENGYFEYYQPETGQGLGADQFGWTSALYIDIAAEYLKAQEG